MIEVSNINPIHKNSLLATCTIYIKPWHLYIHEVGIFESGARRWVNLPSRKWEKDGETKFIPLMAFDSDGVTKRFRDQIMSAVDKFLESNPTCQPEDAIKESDELPF